MDFDENSTIQDVCPACKTMQTIYIAESLNYGNLLAMCDACDMQWDWTPIDHKAIRAEARRGFVWRP